MTVLRDERLQVRVDAVAKHRLEAAASAEHLSLSAFVLRAAQERAADVLADRQAIQLAPDAAAAFDEALARPAMVNERLAAALRRPSKFCWLD